MHRKGSTQGQWSSCWVFIFALAGSAISMSYFGRLPNLIEAYGGAYLLVYIVCLILIGLPLLMLEVMIGRRGRYGPVKSIANLAVESGHEPNWNVLGYLLILTAFIFLSYFSVVAGWNLSYVFRSASGMFEGLTMLAIANLFNDFRNEPEILLAWHTVFMVILMLIVLRGVERGHEKIIKIIVPVMFALIVFLLLYVMGFANLHLGLEKVLSIDFSIMNFNALLSAMTQAFFTLGLGVGAAVMYGSFLPQRFSLLRGTSTAVLICAATVILVSIIIFSVTEANQVDLKPGTSLAFLTMSFSFAQLPYGALAASVFFIVISIAAITTGIAMLEPMVNALMNKMNMRRTQATLIATGFVWGLGIVSVLSVNEWQFLFTFLNSDVEHPFGLMSVFGLLIGLFLIPLCVLFSCIFAGWIMSREASRDELDLGDGVLYKSWRIMVRYVIPVIVTVVFFKLIGIFDRLNNLM